MRWPFLVPFALLASGAAAATPSVPACELRARTLQSLLSAADETGRAGEALAAVDFADAQGRLSAAADVLLAEKTHVASAGRGLLAVKERKGLLKALRGARRRARHGARKLAHAPPADVAAEAVEETSAAIDAVLAAQTTAYATQPCVGAVLQVQALYVAPGETRAVPGGSEIVAAQGATLRGALVVQGAGGFTLTAESGDLALEGTIDGTGGEDAALEDTRRSARAERAGERGAAQPSCGDAEPTRIQARSGGIRIGASFLAVGGLGASCLTRRVDSIGALAAGIANGEFRGRHGGRGGDVIVTAPAGAIVFEPRAASAAGPFATGNGGAGESLLMTAAFLPPAGYAEIGIIGGTGGTSGRFAIDAHAVTLPDVLYGSGGAGGEGGSITWRLPSAVQPFPAELEYLFVSGGPAGPGAVRGGRGGDALYDGGSVVRIVDWAAPPPVEVVGGLGGAALRDALHASGDTVYGGDGGNADAVGHRGRDGTAEHFDGGVGGAVIASGGRAGSFEGTGVAHVLGGNGGTASGRSGRGGDGFASCEIPPTLGGTGGAPGSAEVSGGTGGDAPGGFGGDGGATLLASGGAPGRGGSGEPGGDCGPHIETVASFGGTGGSGATHGAPGEAADAVEAACAGGGGHCPETPVAQACARPRSAISNVVRTLGSVEESWSEIITESCGLISCTTHHLGSYVRTSLTDPPQFEPQETAIDSDGDTFTLSSLEQVRWTFLPHCTHDGVFHPAGAYGVDAYANEVVVHSCSGACDCPAAHPPTQCCPTGDPANPYAAC